MGMFLGVYNPNMTEGSRIALPKKHREQLGSGGVVLSQGFEKCVLVYDKNDWLTAAQKQIDNSSDQIKVRDLERYLYSFATEAFIDAQGRLVIPMALKDYAGIKNKIAVVGVGDHVEIWDAQIWKDYSANISKKLAV